MPWWLTVAVVAQVQEQLFRAAGQDKLRHLQQDQEISMLQSAGTDEARLQRVVLDAILRLVAFRRQVLDLSVNTEAVNPRTCPTRPRRSTMHRIQQTYVVMCEVEDHWPGIAAPHCAVPE